MDREISCVASRLSVFIGFGLALGWVGMDGWLMDGVGWYERGILGWEASEWGWGCTITRVMILLPSFFFYWRVYLDTMNLYCLTVYTLLHLLFLVPASSLAYLTECVRLHVSVLVFLLFRLTMSCARLLAGVTSRFLVF